MFTSKKTLVCALASAFALAAVPAASASVEQTMPLAQGEEEVEAGVEVIFTGFARSAEKGAQIFVRMTGEVPVETDRSGSTLTYRLSGAKLGVPNNANPLPTRHFGPPVSHVSLVAAEGSVNLVIELSGDSEPNHRLVSHGGLATLLVDLPPVK